jgi:hypothetical protein
MQRTLSNHYTARNVDAHTTFADSHPITYRHACDVLARRNISREVDNVALLILPAILQGIAQTLPDPLADPMPGDKIGHAIGAAISRAKASIATDEMSGPRVCDDIVAESDAAQSNGAWLSMGSAPTDAVSVWGRFDSLEAVLTCLAYDDAVTLANAADAASEDDDARTTIESLALRVAGLQRDSRAGKALRVKVREIIADAASYVAPTLVWATVNHAPLNAWDDASLALASDAVKRPGMTRNTWSQGDRTTSGPASLVTCQRDGVVSVLDPRTGDRVPMTGATFADVASVAGSALIVPAWERDADSRASDLYADAQEPLGAVAKPNTRKTKRAGGVGGSVVVGKSRPRRV